MKRTRTKKIVNPPSAILTSDWHLREDTPECRTDDFWQKQWDKVLLTQRLCLEYRCPVIHAGDLYNHWKPSPLLLTYTLRFIPENFWTVYGQHDLPQHNMNLSEKCGIDTLLASESICLCNNGHFSTETSGETNIIHYGKSKIAVWHKLVWEKNPPHWDTDGLTAERVLAEHPEFDLIVTGDNHQSFVVEYEGRLLVNPGSLTRQSADQINHRPAVFLWYAEDNSVEPYYLPVNLDDVTREHLDEVHKRDDRMDAFISSISQEWISGYNFERNIERFFRKNKDIDVKVKEIILKAME